MMRKVKSLLEMLDECIPSHSPARHNVTVANGELWITLMTNKVYPFRLEEEDLDKPVSDIVDAICDLYYNGVT